MPLPVAQLGPLVKGAADAVNAALETTGMVSFARNAYYSGLGRLGARPGTEVAMTLKDDAGTPANVTRVLAVVPFSGDALAVAHSDVTDKFYLYRLTAALDGWYNAAGALQSNLNAEPVGVLWSSEANPEKVTIAEGLGLAFISYNDANDSFTRPNKVYTPPGTIANLQADLDASGAVANVYFKGLVSFQQHLWGWGYGSEASVDANRPELARFGYPFFATDGLGGYFKSTDSFGIGHRVRSYRDRIVAGAVAGDVLYLGTNYGLWPVTGFGRNSWERSRPLDNSYGFAGLQSFVAVQETLYYWSNRGPFRVTGLNPPEFIGAPIAEAIGQSALLSGILLAHDPDRDQVLVLYQNQQSGRVSVLAAFDTERDVWLGPDGDIGLGVSCAMLVTPTTAPGPAGPPTNASTTNIGGSTARANWTAGETGPGTVSEVQIRVQGTTPWTVVSQSAPATGSQTFTELLQSTAYEWRVRHIRNGQASAWLGPVAGSQFTTSSQLLPPSGLTYEIEVFDPVKNTYQFSIDWTNPAEGTGASIEVYVQGPQGSPPTSGTLPLFSTVAIPGRSANYVFGKQTPSRTYWAEIRTVKNGYTPSSYVGLLEMSTIA